MSELNDRRIIPLIEVSPAFIETILGLYGLVQKGEAVALGEGRIASNFLVPTDTAGNVVMRLYSNAYGRSKVQFEIEVLKHLAGHGQSVPHPLPLIQGEDCFFSMSDCLGFIYPALPGHTLSQSELSVDIAHEAGQALSRMVNAGKTFQSTTREPHGDLAFIAGLLRAAKEMYPEFSTAAAGSEMEDLVSSASLIRRLRCLRQGLVHADFFFENVLACDGKISGIIDFGDAYFGLVATDAVIGAMEFAVTEDESWELTHWHAFVAANKSWLKDEQITSETMRDLLLANCARFAVYTLPFTAAEGGNIDSNKYVRRFTKVKHTALGSELKRAWNDALEMTA